MAAGESKQCPWIWVDEDDWLPRPFSWWKHVEYWLILSPAVLSAWHCPFPLWQDLHTDTFWLMSGVLAVSAREPDVSSLVPSNKGHLPGTLLAQRSLQAGIVKPSAPELRLWAAFAFLLPTLTICVTLGGLGNLTSWSLSFHICKTEKRMLWDSMRQCSESLEATRGWHVAHWCTMHSICYHGGWMVCCLWGRDVRPGLLRWCWDTQPTEVSWAFVGICVARWLPRHGPSRPDVNVL
jgi:hypothetical protein